MLLQDIAYRLACNIPKIEQFFLKVPEWNSMVVNKCAASMVN